MERCWFKGVAIYVGGGGGREGPVGQKEWSTKLSQLLKTKIIFEVHLNICIYIYAIDLMKYISSIDPTGPSRIGGIIFTHGVSLSVRQKNINTQLIQR